MKGITKSCSLLLAAVLGTLMIFAGTSCFAAETEPLSDEAEYSVSAECELTNTETAELNTDTTAEEVLTVDEPQSSSDNSLGKNLAIGIGAGFVITLIVCVCIFISYKKHGSTEPYNYSENAKLTLIDSSDVLINTHVEKRKINKDND